MRSSLVPWLVLAVVAGCSGRQGPEAPAPSTDTESRTPQNLVFDAVPLYRQLGMVAAGQPFPFVGRVSYVATPSPDSTHVVVALSFANTALAFAREADNRFRANYVVMIALEANGRAVRQVEAAEELVVSSFREVSRPGESVIFQEIVDVPPGDYSLSVVIRDEATQRTGEQRTDISVPAFTAGALSSPIPVIDVAPRTTLDSVPRLTTSPRGTVIFGRDSVIRVYVEQYATLGEPVQLLVLNESRHRIWSDSAYLPVRDSISSGVIDVPVSRIGIGAASIAVTRPGSADTTDTGVFVAFGEDLPVATFGDMLNFLRYFAAPSRLDRMRSVPDDQRAEAWATFVRETDERPETPAHEELQAYFDRLVVANGRYREEAGPGWMSDRGRVYITLGDPDDVLEPMGNDFRSVRQMVWEYRSLNAQILFIDRTGTGLWRMHPSSRARFDAEFRRRLK